MIKLTENYGDRPAAELPLLFTRILQNAIHDFFRRQKVRSTWVTLFSAFGNPDDEDGDPARTHRGRGWVARGRECRRPGFARAGRPNHRRRDRAAAGASTRSFSAALLGGLRRRGNRGGHGLLRRQRQDSLFARHPRAGKSLARSRYHTMKQENFAFHIRQALNEGAAHIDYKSQLRLQKAREAALARLKPSPRPQTISIRVPTLQLGTAAWSVAGRRAGAWSVALAAWRRTRGAADRPRRRLHRHLPMAADALDRGARQHGLRGPDG